MKTFKTGLNKAQAKKLFDFCQNNSVDKFFFAKDQGAYFGATKGSQSEGDFKNCIVYLQGCDPDKNEDFYETCRNRFGGDDFGEHFEVNLLNEFVSSNYKRLNFNFNKQSISVSFSG